MVKHFLQPIIHFDAPIFIGEKNRHFWPASLPETTADVNPATATPTDLTTAWAVEAVVRGLRLDRSEGHEQNLVSVVLQTGMPFTKVSLGLLHQIILIESLKEFSTRATQSCLRCGCHFSILERGGYPDLVAGAALEHRERSRGCMMDNDGPADARPSFVSGRQYGLPRAVL